MAGCAGIIKSRSGTVGPTPGTKDVMAAPSARSKARHVACNEAVCECSKTTKTVRTTDLLSLRNLFCATGGNFRCPRLVLKSFVLPMGDFCLIL